MICICALYLSVKACMRMSITQILTTLCVQFYTCIYHGDMNKLQRAWDNLKVVKHQMNWAKNPRWRRPKRRGCRPAAARPKGRATCQLDWPFNPGTRTIETPRNTVPHAPRAPPPTFDRSDVALRTPGNDQREQPRRADERRPEAAARATRDPARASPVARPGAPPLPARTRSRALRVRLSSHAPAHAHAPSTVIAPCAHAHPECAHPVHTSRAHTSRSRAPCAHAPCTHARPECAHIPVARTRTHAPCARPCTHAPCVRPHGNVLPDWPCPRVCALTAVWTHTPVSWLPPRADRLGGPPHPAAQERDLRAVDGTRHLRPPGTNAGV